MESLFIGGYTLKKWLSIANLPAGRQGPQNCFAVTPRSQRGAILFKISASSAFPLRPLRYFLMVGGGRKGGDTNTLISRLILMKTRQAINSPVKKSLPYCI